MAIGGGRKLRRVVCPAAVPGGLYPDFRISPMDPGPRRTAGAGQPLKTITRGNEMNSKMLGWMLAIVALLGAPLAQAQTPDEIAAAKAQKDFIEAQAGIEKAK